MSDEHELTGFAASDIETGYAASDIETGYAASDIETGAEPPGIGIIDPPVAGAPMVKGDAKFFMVRTTSGRFYACVHAESELGRLQICLQVTPAAAAKLLHPIEGPVPVSVGWMSPEQEVVGFNLFHAIKDAGNAIHKAGDFLKIPGWNVTTALLTGHNPIEGLRQDVHNFEQAGSLATAVASGNYGKAWELATNNGKIYHPEVPAPPGRDYHPHALWHDHPEAMAYHRALLAPPAPPVSVGWMGPAQTATFVGYALDHAPGTLEHDASPVVRSLGRVADNAAAALAEAAAVHGLPPSTHEAARLVARAHLGDHKAHAFIRDTMREARRGHPEAMRREHELSRASEFVARHVDKPRILAKSIPIPATAHVAQSGIGLNDPNVRFAHSVEALRRGDLKSLRRMADQELAEMRGVVSLVPGIGSGVTAAMATGERLLHSGHSLEEALRATYGAIPIPVAMRPTTDTVLETVFTLLKNPHALTDGSLAIARARIPSGVPRDVYDTLIHVVAKHQPIGRDAATLRGHYSRHMTQGIDAALDHGLKHVLPPSVSKVLGRLPHHHHRFATVHPGLKEIAHVAEDLRAGVPRVGPPSGQLALETAAPTTGARGGGSRGGFRGGYHGGYHPHYYPAPALPYAYPAPALPAASDGDDDGDGDGDESTGARFGGFRGRGRGRFDRGFGRRGHHFPHPSAQPYGGAQPAPAAQPAAADDGSGGDAGDAGDDDGSGDESTGAFHPLGVFRNFMHPGSRPGQRPPPGPHPAGMHWVPGKGFFNRAGIGLDGLPMGHAPGMTAPGFHPGFHPGYRPGAFHPGYGHPYAHRPLPPTGQPSPYVAPPTATQAPISPPAAAPATQDASAAAAADADAAQPYDPGGQDAAPDQGPTPDANPQAADATDDAPAQPADQGDADELAQTNADASGEATDPSVTAGRGFGRGYRGRGRFAAFGGYPGAYAAPSDGEDLGDESTGLGTIIPSTYRPHAAYDEGDESTGFAYGPALLGAAAGAGALYAFQQWQHRRMAESGAAAGEAANAAAAATHKTSGEFDMGDPMTTAGEFDMGDPMTTAGEFDMGDPMTTAGADDMGNPETMGYRGGYRGGYGGRGYEHERAELAAEQAALDADQGTAAPYYPPEWDRERQRFHEGRRL
jgi:hypothetical protein